MKNLSITCGLLAIAAGAAWGEVTPVFTEDFESGLAAWTTKVFGADIPNNNTPLLFSPGDPLLYENSGNPGSQSAGYSSDMSPWDGQQPQYLRRLMPAAVPAGTYDITFELDVYVYYGAEPPPANPWGADPWGVGNRVYVLSDGLYNNPSFNYDINDPAVGLAGHYWPGDPHSAGNPTWANNGQWQHVVLTKSVTTTTGNLEIRLLMHEKHEGPQAVAWDNVQLTVKQGETEIFSFSDDFESGLGNWAAMVGIANNDSPMTFTANDPLLYDNVDNPGSMSGGYSSNLASYDNTQAAWMQRQFPGLLTPGTHTLRLEMDVYRYIGEGVGDPWGVGNRVYVLTDDQYDDPSWHFDQGDPSPGFRLNYWPGWNDDLGEEDRTHDGVWQHVVIERDVTTATGNIEFRLLLHDKHAGPQAVAWDNISLSIVTPCHEPRFDLDGDLDVDQVDFGLFQVCITGVDDPAGIFDPEGCRCMNTDGDLDIDQSDFGAFQLCISGPTLAADPTCDDALPPP